MTAVGCSKFGTESTNTQIHHQHIERQKDKKRRMSCTVDVVVKFGGSAITVKDQLETLQPDVLVQVSRLIKGCLQKQLTCIVVHGAGSFGHHDAKRYNVHKGWSGLAGDEKAVKSMKYGFCRVRQSVTMLHTLVQDSLVREDIPAVGLSCCGVWETDGGNVVQHNMAAIKDLMQTGFVPVLHGDCVLDRQMGCTILSGDTIIQTICEECSVGRVVFLTSVNGVYNKSPETHKDAVLYRSIVVDKAGKISPSTNILSTDTKSESCNTQSRKTTVVDMDSSDNQTHNTCHDVTGGMSLKFSTAINIVRSSEGRTLVFVCKADGTSATSACLYGHFDEDGTVFKFVA